jgi:glycosyltransferase involved in cell wall biosynthesis
MLQEGALRIKPVKKKLFLAALKFFQVFNGIRWHATDDQEKKDIACVIGSDSTSIVAANVPKHLAEKKRKDKMKGQLRLVFLSLITEKKNLHVVLEALRSVKTPITFHMFGPVKDQSYWDKCQNLMRDQIHEVSYDGSVNASEVQDKLSAYDVFILPTKGENFGHAIYEALSVGTPVIISQHTPWQVAKGSGGMIIESENPDDWAKAIQRLVDLDAEQHAIMSKGAYSLARDYFFKNDFKSQYMKLFS